MAITWGLNNRDGLLYMYIKQTPGRFIHIMLRLVIVLLCYVACTLQQQRGNGHFNDFMRHRQDCMQELNLNPSDFHFTQRDIIDNTRVNASSDVKCMVRCVFQKMGLLDENDELQVEVVKKKMHFYDGGLVDLDRCKSFKAEKNKCDAALMVRRCIWVELGKQVNHGLYARIGEICMRELDLNYTLTQAVRYIALLDQEGDEADGIDDKDERCLLACAMRRLGYFDDEGELLVEVVKVTVREMQEVDVEKCAELKKDDVCGQILAVRKCLLDEMKKKQKSN